METFVDTCIIFTAFDKMDKYHEVINIFLEGNERVIISVYQEKEEIPRWFLRKQKFFMEAIKFLKNNSYAIDYTVFTDSEKIILKKLTHQIVGGIETEESLMKKHQELLLLRKKVLEFIQIKVSKKVTPIEDLNQNLINIIRKENNNKADAKVISSAIQEHQKNQLIAFTLDKKDWKILPIKEKIERLDYRCPEIRFLR